MGGSDSTNLEQLITFNDSAEEQLATRALISRYLDIFSTDVHKIPAELTPLQLEVDAVEWNHRRNRGPARVQPRIKQDAIVEQITAMTKIGVIVSSQASY